MPPWPEPRLADRAGAPVLRRRLSHGDQRKKSVVLGIRCLAYSSSSEHCSAFGSIGEKATGVGAPCGLASSSPLGSPVTVDHHHLPRVLLEITEHKQKDLMEMLDFLCTGDRILKTAGLLHWFSGISDTSGTQQNNRTTHSHHFIQGTTHPSVFRATDLTGIDLIHTLLACKLTVRTRGWFHSLVVGVSFIMREIEVALTVTIDSEARCVSCTSKLSFEEHNTWTELIKVLGAWDLWTCDGVVEKVTTA